MTATLSPPVALNRNPPALPDVSRIRNQGALIDAFVWIMRLSRNRRRFCWAYNKTLAELLKCSDDKVTRLIDRLAALGAVVVEQIVGIERRVRPIITLDALKAILFRGHESNRIAAPPARKAPSRRSVAAPSAETPAEPVAEGHKRESVGLLITPPTEEGQRTQPAATGTAPTLPPAPVPVVVSSPTASPTVDHQLVAAIEALGIPKATALRLTASKPATTVRQALKVVQGLCQSGKARNPGALLTAAIREGYLPSAPPSEHASDHGDRPVNVIRAPKEYLERVASQAGTAPEGSRIPVEAPLPSVAADDARDAARALVQRLRGARA